MGPCVLFIMLVLWTGSSAVTVSVKSPVYLQLPAEKLILPCSFSMQNGGVECTVTWEHGLVNSSAVISKHATGDIFPGPSYKDRAWVGSGCTCEVNNPNENNAGIYKVEVVCYEDHLSHNTALVDVILIPKEAAHDTTYGILNTSSHTGRSTSSTQSTVDEEQADNIGVHVAVAVAVSVVLGVVCVAVIIGIICYYRLRRRPESAHHNKNDIETQPFLPNNGGRKDPEKDSERYQKWCKDTADKHVRTTLYHQVLTKLGQTKSVLLLADAGDGKSTLLQLVAIQYGEDGFLTLQIDTPTDINNYNTDANKRILFVCDSLLGETAINEHKTEAWKNSENEQFPDHAKFLFACRLEFWGKKKADLCRKQIFNETVEVRSGKLTPEDKKKTLDQHFGDKLSEDTKKLIAENANFAFPECCRFVSQSLNIDFSDKRKLKQIFTNPFNFVVKQLETIEKNNKMQYAILVFCLLNEREFPRTGGSDVCKKSNFELVRKLYLSDITCSEEQLYDTLLDNVSELDDWLLTRNGDNYTFYHDTIFEAMCRHHGDRYPGHILTFCKTEVVFTVFTTNQASGSDSDRVTLSAHCYPQLVEVLTTELVKKWTVVDSELWGFVFKHLNKADVLKEWSVFLTRKLSLIKEASPPRISPEQTEPTLFDVLKLLTQLPDCDLSVDKVFVRAAYQGDLQTSRLALESGVDSDSREYGLMYAAHQRHMNIVRMTVQRKYPDIQHMSYIEELYEAISSDSVERVVEMMRSQSDMNTDIKHMVIGWTAEKGHNDVVRVMVERTDMDKEGIMWGLAGAVWSDNVECLKEILRVRPDLDTDIIQWVLRLAVRYGRARSVKELLRRLDISKQTIQMLHRDDSKMFYSQVRQSVREETRSVLVKHLDTDN